MSKGKQINEVRYVDENGSLVGADDQWWEQTYRHYEVEGVPTELVNMARPLLGGTVRQQREAHKFLMDRAGTWNADGEDLARMHLVLQDQGEKITGGGAKPSDEDFMKAWDEMDYGNDSTNGGRWKVGKSGEATHVSPADAKKNTDYTQYGEVGE